MHQCQAVADWSAWGSWCASFFELEIIIEDIQIYEAYTFEIEVP
jgi:hypothetical protein